MSTNIRVWGVADTSSTGAADQITEASGPTTLDIDAIADGEYLRRVGSTIVGGNPAGSGDVTAAAAFAIDNRVVRSDGTGKGVQASTVTISDAGEVSGITTISASGAITGSNLSGTNTGDQTITLTGDVTGSGTGSFATTIAAGAVTYAQIQSISAASRILGRGDSGSGSPQELTIGAGLAVTGTTLSATGGGSGDVVGPASSTDEAFARFDLATGKLLQDSPVTCSDAGVITGVDDLTLTGSITMSALETVDGRDVSADGSALDSLVSNAVTAAADFTTDERLLRSDGTGKGAQASTIAVTDAGAVSGITSLAASGAITGSNLSGTNTGDQTITLTGDVTGSGTGSFAATIANSAVTFAKIQNIGAEKLLGRGNGGGAGDLEEITLGTNLSLSGTTLNAIGSIPVADWEVIGTGQSTGLVNGGVLSIGAPNTTFSVSDGTGFIVDSTTVPGVPTYTKVSWTGKTNIAVTNIATQNITFVHIDSGGNVVQQSTKWTPEQYRDNIILGVVVHVDRATVDAVNQEQLTRTHIVESIADVMDGIGFVNVSGNVFSPNGATMQINKSLGYMLAHGSNYDVDPKNPNIKTLGALSPATFQYRYQDGDNGPTGTGILPNTYDVGGIATAVGVNKWTVQRIYSFVSNNVKIQFGQTEYNNKADAKAAIGSQVFVTEPSIAANGLLRGFLVVKQGATNLSDPLQAEFLTANKFGDVAAGSAPASVSTLQSAYHNSSTNPEILTSTTGGALQLRQGTGADTDVVLEVQNGAGAGTATILGNGTIAALNLSGTNTGDQTITLTGDVTGSGTGSFAATIADNAVTYAQMQDASAASRIIGRGSAGGAGNLEELTVGSGLVLTGTVLSATSDVVGPASATDNAFARFDLTTGKLLQDSPVTCSDTGVVTGIDDLTLTGSITMSALETVDGRDISADWTTSSTHFANTSNPHSVTAGQVGAIPTAEKGAALGVATLDASTFVVEAAQVLRVTGQSLTAGAVTDGQFFVRSGTTYAGVTHDGTGDPHTQYQLESEKAAANGYASLDASSFLVQAAQVLRVTGQNLTAGACTDGQFLTRSGTTYAGVTHDGTGDPHTQYQLESEKSAANGYAALNANTRLTEAAEKIYETGGPTTLTFGAIADGELVVRSGTTLIGTTASTAAAYLYGPEIPASGLGANGDTFERVTTGEYYAKSGGAWAKTGEVSSPMGFNSVLDFSYLPRYNSGTSNTAVGMTAPTLTGSQTGEGYSTASARQAAFRTSFAPNTTANALASAVQSAGLWVFNTSASSSHGRWQLKIRFGLDAVTSSNFRFFVGLCTTTTFTVDPSTASGASALGDRVGLIVDANTALAGKWFVNAGGSTQNNTTASTLVEDNWYEFVLWNEPGSAVVNMELWEQTSANSAFTLASSIAYTTTAITDVVMRPTVAIANAGTAAASGTLHFGGIVGRALSRP